MKDIDYKDSLNLPHTPFPMKANLAQREPATLKFWDSIELYETLRKQNKGKPRYILNDGPPYANGPIHIGHAVNKILKDMIIKAKQLSGFDVPYVPGWDCHGMPIELEVERQFGKPGQKIDAKTFREKCRAYAEKFIASQRLAFIRLGIFGDWFNPYETMNFRYEADIMRSIGKIIEKGHLHKGFKPVHWCVECASALSEAEVEYQDKQSLSIEVAFKEVGDSLSQRLTWIEPCETAVSVVIWTTTPWTLPANEAVALNPSYAYVVVEIASNRRVLLAEGLLEAFAARHGIDKPKILAHGLGQALEGARLHHPLYERNVPIVLGEHVSLEAGTGCVHTAPAHGVDDFYLGEKYQLPLLSPVGPNGCYLDTVPELAKQFVFKAQTRILELLVSQGRLISEQTITHSYPHCWRHKTPLIFRATPQWFISMEQAGLRRDALEAIKTVSWYPEWGQARIEKMVANRPDWCVSRQRTWGVPLGLFVHKETEALHPQAAKLIEKVAQLVELAGIEAWYDLDVEAFLGDEAKDYQKIPDTVDVWLDSGVAHECVLRARPELGFPADLYLEGSDQHRGWFQSSLLTSVAMNGIAPFRQVVTHGFTVDAKGHKMSKSLGNVIAPDKVVTSLGADVLRLWVAATDYRGEMHVSSEILSRTSDAYRRIRNTARFLLANLNGFEPANHLVPVDRLLALDRWLLQQVTLLQADIRVAYDEFNFHAIFHKLHNFCVTELGSFYLDIIKDRQYTSHKEGIARRSAQSVLYHTASAFVAWIAPILSFTAEEIWACLPGERKPSVFLSEWYDDLPQVELDSDFDHTFWQTILNVRTAVNKVLEEARTQNLIGSGLQAELKLYCAHELYNLLMRLGDELKFILISSKAQVFALSDKPDTVFETAIDGLFVEIKASDFEKCERCWHRTRDVNTHVEWPNICSRCVSNIAGNGEVRLYA